VGVTPVMRGHLRQGPLRIAIVRSVVLVLHGGREHSKQPTSAGQLAYRRMVPIARSLRRAVGAHAAVWLVRNRVRGWNEPDRDALIDAESALDTARQRHPGAAIVLVGHSMGGRAALLAAGAAGVVGVCALAPWLESGDPVDQLAGRAVVLAHGDRDTWTDPARSEAYARRVRGVTPDVCRFVVRGAGHAMLRRAGDWTGLVRAFVAGMVGASAPHPLIVAGMRTPAPDGLRLLLPRRP
jgi:dienelactone hydrolase